MATAVIDIMGFFSGSDFSLLYPFFLPQSLCQPPPNPAPALTSAQPPGPAPSSVALLKAQGLCGEGCQLG